ncbi:MAG TPA: methyltransferase domain-containing protein [Planctomycetia bacterium]|nr:methyltransferase domain-containing protein [Planctomycetia bacterium]
MTLPDRSTFETAYLGRPPWDVEHPQHCFIDVVERIVGSVIDAGCGTGENALYFAARGCKVTGIDFLEAPIERARAKAAERRLKASFLVMDALALKEIPELFDVAIDSGLFHVFSDADRVKYAAGLRSVLKPGGRLFLLCFSDAEPGEQGPRRVSRAELEACFAAGWKIESLEPARFDVRSDSPMEFSPGGPHAWFLIARRPA